MQLNEDHQVTTHTSVTKPSIPKGAAGAVPVSDDEDFVVTSTKAPTTSTTQQKPSKPVVSTKPTSGGNSGAEPVRWTWKNDSGGWSDYSDDVVSLIERAYVNGDQKYQFDKERYLDFAQMLQKRVDNPQKVRPVQRRGPPVVRNKQALPSSTSFLSSTTTATQNKSPVAPVVSHAPPSKKTPLFSSTATSTTHSSTAHPPATSHAPSSTSSHTTKSSKLPSGAHWYWKSKSANF